MTEFVCFGNLTSIFLTLKMVNDETNVPRVKSIAKIFHVSSINNMIPINNDIFVVISSSFQVVPQLFIQLLFKFVSVRVYINFVKFLDLSQWFCFS